MRRGGSLNHRKPSDSRLDLMQCSPPMRRGGSLNPTDSGPIGGGGGGCSPPMRRGGSLNWVPGQAPLYVGKCSPPMRRGGSLNGGLQQVAHLLVSVLPSD